MLFEVRRVTEDWEHPLDTSGTSKEPGYLPLFRPHHECIGEWEYTREKWKRRRMYLYHYGEHRDELRGHTRPTTEQDFVKFAGPRPDPAHHMPAWPPEAQTHWQLYEISTEGTPVSPVFATSDALLDWIMEKKIDQQILPKGVSALSRAEWLDSAFQGALHHRHFLEIEPPAPPTKPLSPRLAKSRSLPNLRTEDPRTHAPEALQSTARDRIVMVWAHDADPDDNEYLKVTDRLRDACPGQAEIVDRSLPGTLLIVGSEAALRCAFAEDPNWHIAKEGKFESGPARAHPFFKPTP